MEVRTVAMLVPKKTNDHLDYYAISSLIKSGYADLEMTTGGRPIRELSEMQLAIDLYMWVEGKGTIFQYRGIASTGSDFSTEKIFATAKAYLLFDEIKTKRTERLWAFSVGIVTAIVATSLKGLLA